MSNIIQRLENAQDKFLAIFRAVHKASEEEAKNFFEVEKFAFRRAVEESPALMECSDLSIASTFLEVISNGLSFDKSAKHVYLIPRSVKVGQNWEKRMTYSYACDGLIYLCTAAGSIQGCSTPVIVYKGDQIEVKTIDGRLTINHSPAIPRASEVILGGYCYITERNERIGFWMSVEEASRLIKFSEKANGGKANALYTSGPDGQIDSGFFSTKIAKAALKNKRKKKTVNDNYFDEEVVEDNSPEGFIPQTVESEVAPVEVVPADEVRQTQDLIF